MKSISKRSGLSPNQLWKYNYVAISELFFFFSIICLMLTMTLNLEYPENNHDNNKGKETNDATYLCSNMQSNF